MFVTIIAVTVLILLVVIEGVSSFTEGTFYSSQSPEKGIRLPFILHGGVVVGDLILIPLAIYFGGPYLKCSVTAVVVYFIVALLITLICHHAWWIMLINQPGFMYPDRKGSMGIADYWYKDLPVSAWIHFVYMIFAVMYIEAYIFSPMPADVVWKTFWIFVIFVPVAVIEPGIVPEWPPKKKDIVNSIVSAVVLWGIVGLVTWAKLAHLQLHWHFINIRL